MEAIEGHRPWWPEFCINNSGVWRWRLLGPGPVTEPIRYTSLAAVTSNPAPRTDQHTGGRIQEQGLLCAKEQLVEDRRMELEGAGKTRRRSKAGAEGCSL